MQEFSNEFVSFVVSVVSMTIEEHIWCHSQNVSESPKFICVKNALKSCRKGVLVFYYVITPCWIAKKYSMTPPTYRREFLAILLPKNYFMKRLFMDFCSKINFRPRGDCQKARFIAQNDCNILRAFWAMIRKEIEASECIIFYAGQPSLDWYESKFQWRQQIFRRPVFICLENNNIGVCICWLGFTR